MLKFVIPIILILVVYLWIRLPEVTQNTVINPVASPRSTQRPTPIVQKPKVQLQTLPESKTLPNSYHIFQSYNNCGPAALSMALSYYGINQSQTILGEALRPYQIPGGDNDDKSVTLEELAEKSKEYGLIPYHRPNGNIELIKLFVTYDIPIITRTWLKENDDIGHYRVVKGFDQATNSITQDDSLQGKNLIYTNDQFNAIWKKFNYEYLVLVPQDKKEIAESILGDEADPKVSWTNAVKNAENQLQSDPNDIYARFNLSVALHNIGDYQRSVEEFEKIESKLPFRTLWYQIEPIQSYYELGNYQKVLSIIDRILNYHNRAFSELYLIRGKIYLKQGNKEAARQEFEKAIQYNRNLKSAQEALENLEN